MKKWTSSGIWFAWAHRSKSSPDPGHLVSISCGPPSAVEAKGGTARLAPRQSVETLTASSTDGVPQTRDVEAAARYTAAHRSLGDNPSRDEHRGEHTSVHRKAVPAGKRQRVRARRTGTDEHKPDADRLVRSQSLLRHEPAEG